MTDTLRLFVGIYVGEEWTERLSARVDHLRDGLGRAVRWVRPDLYHVTVVFLGNQSLDAAEEIGDALTVAAERSSSFTLHLRDVHRLGGHEHGALVAGVDDRSGRSPGVSLASRRRASYAWHRLRFEAAGAARDARPAARAICCDSARRRQPTRCVASSPSARSAWSRAICSRPALATRPSPRLGLACAHRAAALAGGRKPDDSD